MKPKTIKCSECNKVIPASTEALIECKSFCQDCFSKKKTQKQSKQKISDFWKKWG